jgi:hypothetical protein
MRPENYPPTLIVTGMAALCMRAVCHGCDHRDSDLLSRPDTLPERTSAFAIIVRRFGAMGLKPC